MIITGLMTDSWYPCGDVYKGWSMAVWSCDNNTADDRYPCGDVYKGWSMAVWSFDSHRVHHELLFVF